MTTNAWKPMYRSAVPHRPDDAIWTPTTTPVTARFPFWQRYLGTSTITVRSAGVWPGGRRKPVLIITDPLALEWDGAAPKSGGGLLPLDAPEYAALALLARQAVAQDILTLVPFDFHTNPALFDNDALTPTRLTKQLYEQLLPEDRRKIERYPSLAERLLHEDHLTVGEWRVVFGEPQDAEFGLFFVHCQEEVAQLAPVFGELLDAERARISNDIAAGIAAPDARIIPFPKLGLSDEVAPDERGLHGNHFDAILRASQHGHPQGARYDEQRTVIIAGTALNYTVLRAALHAMMLRFNVRILLSSTCAIPGGGSKLSLLRQHRELYTNGLTAQYGWPDELLGPAPAGYAALAAQVLAADRQEHAATAPQVSNAFTDLGGATQQVIADW